MSGISLGLRLVEVFMETHQVYLGVTSKRSIRVEVEEVFHCLAWTAQRVLVLEALLSVRIKVVYCLLLYVNLFKIEGEKVR